MKNEVMKVFNAYTEALSKGNVEAVFETMSDDIVWHMGGGAHFQELLKESRRWESV